MNQYVGKFDFYATKNDHISLSIGSNKEPILNPFFGANIPGFTSAATTNWDYFGNIAYTKTISLSTLNELLITAQRFCSNRSAHQSPAYAIAIGRQYTVRRSLRAADAVLRQRHECGV